MSAPPAKSRAEMAAYGFTFAAACAPFVSIAASQILLGAALVAVLIHYRSLRMPRGLAVPLVLFFAGTLIALALSPDPRAGFPQLKKFYVYLILPVAYTAFSGLKDVRRIVLGWTVLASASGTWSFVQFFMKRQKALAAGEDFYRSYIGDRTTGFMSHWMTFGAEQMMALLLLLSALIFGLLQRHKILLWSGMAVISVSIVLGQTRSVWLGSALGAGYLIAAWRPKLLLVLPFAMPLGWFAAPRSVQERVISIYRPHGTTDSNQHRVVTARTGIEMIKASPWVGLGPEIVGRDFHRYVPPDIPMPLPDGFYGHLHNVYLQYGADRGLPTLAMFLWFVGAGLAHMIRTVRSFPAVAHGSLAAMIGILTEGFFEFNLNDSEVLSMFLIVVVCSFLVTKQEATPL